MKFRHLNPLAVGVVLALAAGSNGATAQNVSIYQATLMESEARTGEVSTDQLRQIMAEGSAILIDTRTRAEFDAGHIPGAHVLDSAADQQVAAVERLAKGDKAAALVLYCNGPYCQASRRLGDQLVAAGFADVRRYQLGLPVWRALGGPTAIEPAGLARIYNVDRTAVYFDVRAPEEFAAGSLPGAHSVPVDEVIAGKLKKLPLPEDDFNRRIVLFGGNAAQARKLAEVLRTRPWHNVSYVAGPFAALTEAVKPSSSR